MEEASGALALEILGRCMDAVSDRGRFSLVLAGGGTPQLLYTLLATEYRDAIPWDKVHLFWGDERFVLHDDPESNFKMVMDTLISKVPIPVNNIHPIPTEIETPRGAARKYGMQLKRFLGRVGTFDVVLLGIGSDGHTASLFPGDPVLKEKKKRAAAVEAPEGYTTKDRITLTLPVINAARNIFVLAGGKGKGEVLKAIVEDQEEAGEHYPAALVKGNVEWYVDEDAVLW